MSIIDSEVEMMQRVMGRSIDGLFEDMAGNHVGVVNLYEKTESAIKRRRE